MLPRLVVCAVLAATVVSAQPSADQVRLAIPDRTNAFPSIAASGDFVAVTWGASSPGGSADVFLAVSRDGGRTFADPIRVNRIAGETRLGGELPPRVALVRRARGDPEIVVAWGAKAASTTIRIARSTDGGRTLGPETVLQAGDAAGDRGWHALTVDAEGTAHVVWLDHRRLALRPKATGHDHHADGAGMAQFSDLRYAAVSARGVEQAERALFPGVCYCCKTALVAGSSGQLFAAWRQVYPGNIRDIAFARSLDGGRTFSAHTRVSEDRWQLAGCPDDGPAMALDARGTIHIVWPTVIGGAEPTGAIFYASSRDGRTFSERQRVPTLGSVKPSHPQIVIDRAGTIVVAWDEVLDGVRRAAAVTATPSGSGLSYGRPRWLVTDASTYAVIAAANAGVLGAWTSNPGPNAVIGVGRIR